ncbi:MAG TPA: hypothetical protein VLR52_03715, partial [Bacteroidales bacterium]|nr:hypothetical protein [Bacteroidales bacterium]
MKQLFYLTLVLLLFAGCGEKSNQINYAKDVIFKQMDTLCFKPGTYWVYGLRNSQTVDCVYVVKVKRSVYNVDYIGNVGVMRDYYEMTVGNSANETYVYWIES